MGRLLPLTPPPLLLPDVTTQSGLACCLPCLCAGRQPALAAARGPHGSGRQPGIRRVSPCVQSPLAAAAAAVAACTAGPGPVSRMPLLHMHFDPPRMPRLPPTTQVRVWGGAVGAGCVGDPLCWAQHLAGALHPEALESHSHEVQQRSPAASSEMIKAKLAHKSRGCDAAGPNQLCRPSPPSR